MLKYYREQIKSDELELKESRRLYWERRRDVCYLTRCYNPPFSAVYKTVLDYDHKVVCECSITAMSSIIADVLNLYVDKMDSEFEAGQLAKLDEIGLC
jgi:hypothetical protein